MRTSLITHMEVDLTVARGHGDFRVHLVEARESRTLCGQPLRARPPDRSFREVGCTDCLASAVGVGYIAAREGEGTWINLTRM